MTTYIVDIDGTLCSLHPANYEKAQPYQDAINLVNSFYDEGHTIIIETGRGSTTGVGKWIDITKKQLNDWGVKYHQLKFVWKPGGDYLRIDDKCCRMEELLADK